MVEYKRRSQTYCLEKQDLSDVEKKYHFYFSTVSNQYVIFANNINGF